ncbi:MAG: hypothetical protein AAB215_01870, partial [Planctomycetota bacterium]
MPIKTWYVGLDVSAATAMVLLVDGQSQIRCRQRTKLRPQDGHLACLERLGGLVDEALGSVSVSR